MTPATQHAASNNGGHAAAPMRATVKKVDEDERLVYGEVYAPGFPDSQGDWMTAETIKEMAFDFMRQGNINKIDVQHSQVESGCYVVESFIARDCDDTFIPGSWVLGVKVADDATWHAVKSGELNGFSLDGMAVQVPTLLTYELPDQIKGGTDFALGHSHTFSISYGPNGEFLGGKTDRAPDGHYHEIRAGTITEIVNGHSHRFSYIEGIMECRQ